MPSFEKILTNYEKKNGSFYRVPDFPAPILEMFPAPTRETCSLEIRIEKKSEYVSHNNPPTTPLLKCDYVSHINGIYMNDKV